MREILFRGKAKESHNWLFGDFLRAVSDGVPWILPTNEAEEVKVFPETVGQYTGMTDKNGKKIFEGDILLFAYIGMNKGVSGKEAVVFEKGKFGVLWGWHRDFVCLDGFANTTQEIIGNIHDNPELLEV